jgi:predicted nucleic acid-binding Zn ribbon protein
MEGHDFTDHYHGEQQHPEEMKKKMQQKQTLAMLISFMVIVVALLMAIQRDPNTGSISLNPMIIFLGIVLGVFIFLGLTIQGRQDRLIRLRFCVSCGRNIPFDAVVCPYCRYDYEKNRKLD